MTSLLFSITVRQPSMYLPRKHTHEYVSKKAIMYNLQIWIYIHTSTYYKKYKRPSQKKHRSPFFGLSHPSSALALSTLLALFFYSSKVAMRAFPWSHVALTVLIAVVPAISAFLESALFHRSMGLSIITLSLGRTGALLMRHRWIRLMGAPISHGMTICPSLQASASHR